MTAEAARKIALEAIDLFLEYRDKHGKEESEARENTASEFEEAYGFDPNAIKGTE